jgi:hypothetical protein
MQTSHDDTEQKKHKFFESQSQPECRLDKNETDKDAQKEFSARRVECKRLPFNDVRNTDWNLRGYFKRIHRESRAVRSYEECD